MNLTEEYKQAIDKYVNSMTPEEFIVNMEAKGFKFPKKGAFKPTLTRGEILNRVKGLEPLDENYSLHIYEQVYDIDGNDVRLMWTIGGDGQEPYIEVNEQEI